jgi:hypothetical protein
VGLVWCVYIAWSTSVHGSERTEQQPERCAAQQLLAAGVHMDLAPWRGPGGGVTADMLNASVYEAHHKAPSGIYTSSLVRATWQPGVWMQGPQGYGHH